MIDRLYDKMDDFIFCLHIFKYAKNTKHFVREKIVKIIFKFLLKEILFSDILIKYKNTIKAILIKKEFMKANKQ